VRVLWTRELSTRRVLLRPVSDLWVLVLCVAKSREGRKLQLSKERKVEAGAVHREVEYCCVTLSCW
jgi:hypothetical protein